ncbi:CopG family transcriptional regulator [Nesterenkonia sp. CF4.4]|uniref:CopG family transcriptional regulator n=1 Tax=Nesterenkonia sp. CF4.4 TaxID=3373079 RepID=UPI003EE5A106
MDECTAVNGKTFTEEDIEASATEAESEQDYTDCHLGPPKVGRPVSIGADARPFTMRLDANRRAKLDKAAYEQHTTASALMRSLIDSL